MQKIHYLKIQNFKVFGEETTIHFDNPTVLIGANNSGKTSVIQALSLWSWAVQTWFEKKKNSKSNKERGVALNRKEIPQITIKESRFFWHKAKIRKNSNENIDLTIKVGVFYENQIQEVGMIFKYHSPETLYCQPTEEILAKKELLEFVTQLKMNLLYPIVGMKAEEDSLSLGSIQRIIGQGQAASVIRNICNLLFENDKEKWAELLGLMKTLFSVEIKKPIVLSNGLIELYYNYADSALKSVQDLDISLAGYGQQQMLLVLAYLLANQNSVLMIDEPDAHLEILRQNQIFSVLKEIAQKYDCQVIVVTHSEVVLNEAQKIVFLADGMVQEISDKNEHKFIKNALSDFGIEHYYKARLNPHILYVEGSTDISMLKAFARKFNHSSLSIFEGKLNFYYTQNEIPQNSLENELQIKAGAYKKHKQHFNAIKSVIPTFKGIGIFDGDNSNRQDDIKSDLAIMYWKSYELENYFITPKIILAFAAEELKKRQVKGLLLSAKLEKLKDVIDEKMILPVLNQDKNAFKDFKEMSENLQNVQFQNLSTTKKLSLLLENVFAELAKVEQEPILLSKGNFYLLIEFMENMPTEVNEKLNEIEKYLAK
jgi:AAA15 family ATPase/GTPase